ncbi:DUF1501 domain-containing protein [Tuwongella immobilis]|uniref:DUF1501 domain-containing protein n=1 Tax=Tuwongella immobilis TaxID=692036 RepID=A0A6C2YJI8_9BACT|nr:DUF1501 domain-containing protein [Tuwongella immobilis]VIP01537.1 phosphoglycerol transferase family alkaline phosphatase superfamily : Phosphoglycerol transferase family protein, alkaline phosphatase superfamily OS=Singulisphaera acidiphila (strain ATCC BAA-1392 / DSM 18658 / VKM B-2454 / MOB10) GN=Sinac_7128 PE=4 SV=1: DUF1501 [Tuwongella immobilis]VTR98703.1 phosphoglycerol transferase family alkaline phosphatase superfamily : Phosphoglycerol transferase family protein, alkaline phosphatas
MMHVGSFRSQLCAGITRRSFVTAGMLAPFLMPGGASAAPHRAKSVVLLWLWGAPSHLDTFDPKPNAPSEFRGPFGTIPTRTPGVRFTELFPKMAARSNRFALIRSHKNFDADHLKGGTIGLTGETDLSTTAPNFGSVLARHRGRGDLPGFMAIGRGNPRDVTGPMKGYGGGTWGRTYDPFLVSCADTGETDVPALKILDGLTPHHLTERRTLLGELDGLQRAIDRTAQQKWDQSRERAYALLLSPEARQALDLSRESEQTRERYGQTSFGQACLLARRLVEARVPYIQVNWSQYVEAMTPQCDFGWDTHIFNFDMLMDRHGPILDRVYSTLLDDLDERGLLEDTLVVAMGEFGRTPRINGQASRDHWPRVYSSIWAGAGVLGGRVIGESDPRGEDPLTDPITPAMVGTTMLELAGVDAQARAEYRVLPQGRVIHELF